MALFPNGKTDNSRKTEHWKLVALYERRSEHNDFPKDHAGLSPGRGELSACAVAAGLSSISINLQADRSRALRRYDAEVELTWRVKALRYAVEVESSSQPMIVERAMLQVRQAVRDSGLNPMVFVPYLSEEALLRLNDAEVSGIDRCGNCVLLGPSMAIWRSGAANRFRESRPIRNPYSGDSSIITRCLLLRRRFGSLDELRRFALSMLPLDRLGNENLLQIGTVSKVVRALQEELITTRDPDGIHLTDPRRLLDRLREQYRPASGTRVLGKTPFNEEDTWPRLADARSEAGRFAATGMASASRYGALVGVERLSFYVDDLRAAIQALDVSEGRAFANIELIEARNNLPFFDCRSDGNAIWASPIQTWLELAQGGPREREAAQNLDRLLLEGRTGELT